MLPQGFQLGQGLGGERADLLEADAAVLVDDVGFRRPRDAEIDRRVTVRHGLRLHALRGVHHQQRLAGGDEFLAFGRLCEQFT